MGFWKWWTSTVVVVIVAAFAQYKLDVFQFILENDSTYISFGIMICFAIATSAIGYYSHASQFKGIKPTENRLMPLWFAADGVMSLGMVGTLLGFLIVLTSTFQDVDTSSAAAMKEVIGQLAAGMGTALLTSLAGLITSIILKLQLIMLESDNEKV